MRKRAAGRLSGFAHALRRFGNFWARFVGAAANFGWMGAVRLYSWQAWRSRHTSVRIRTLGTPFHFRGARDYHVLTLLFKENFQLLSGQFKIRSAVDIGANIGVESVRLIALHPEVRIIAVEADSENFKVLARNLAPYPNAVARLAAAWGEKGRFNVSRDADCAEASVVAPDATGELEGVTVGELIDELGVEELDVLKIDIEGAEDSLFGPSIDFWIGRVRVIVWELNDHEAPFALMRLVSAAHRAGAKFNFTISGEKLVGVRADTPVTVRTICGLLAVS